MKSHSKDEFKAFLLFENAKPKALKAYNQETGGDNVGLCLLKGSSDPAMAQYKVSSSVQNTVLVYRNRTVVAKFVNWTAKDSAKLQAAIDSACAAK